MKTIWKVEIKCLEFGQDNQLIEIPTRAVCLSAQMQRSRLCLWFQVDTEQNKTIRDVRIVGTGRDMGTVHSNRYSYVGSVQTDEQSFVWHVFLENERRM